MAYDANIPQATDQISVSQGQILANFQFLNTIAVGIFEAPVQLLAPVIPAGSNALYTLIPTSAPLTGKNEFFLRNDPAGKNIPITAALVAGTGWSYLPSGLLIKWGSGVSTTKGPASYTYNFPDDGNNVIPRFTSVLSVDVSIETAGVSSDQNTFVQIINFGTLTITLWVGARISTTSASPNFPKFRYIAIGT